MIKKIIRKVVFVPQEISNLLYRRKVRKLMMAYWLKLDTTQSFVQPFKHNG